MLRSILFIHRWLGVVIGLLMTIWCLSGFVMMYVDYPRLSPAEQLRGLAPLQMPAADAMGGIDLPEDTALSSARLEMVGDRAVLRLKPAIDFSSPTPPPDLPPAYDLSTGKAFAELSALQAAAVGDGFARHFGIAGQGVAVTVTPIDQWTVQLARGRLPLYRIDFSDPARSTAYVAGNSGEVVQQTTGWERFWGWLGAVPHWLYPTVLRQDGALWSQVVVWTSLIGCFLTMTGMWVGIARLRRKRDGGIGSPFNGLWRWHHMFGLFFGVLTLTWVASGLFSMNPWGFLDSMAGFAERDRLAGKSDWAAVRGAMSALRAAPSGTVRVEAVPMGGRMYLAAVSADGAITRVGADGELAPLGRAELERALTNGPKVALLELMRTEDDYYYTHRFAMKLPVWRVILTDPERTRIYIDPASGALIQAIDGNGRKFRWLQDGLHSLDFAWMRQRPVWDLIVLPLLALVTLICGTGTWMGFGKVRRDLRRLRSRLDSRS